MFDVLVNTLAAKVFTLLTGIFVLVYIGAYGVITYFRYAAKNGALYASIKQNKTGEQDVELSPKILKMMLIVYTVVNIVAFLFLIAADSIAIQLYAIIALALSEGLIIGTLLLSLNENIGLKVLQLTIITTCITGAISYFANINTAWLGNYLLFALLMLLVLQCIRLFIKITGWKRKIITLIGIVLFIAFLLYDFNLLKSANSTGALNTWKTAIDFAVNIYLDIINLFYNILDLLSDS